MRKHKHKWVVYSTAIAGSAIMVYREKCDALGYVEDFSESEWNDAYFAPNDEYYWEGKGKVILNKKS